MSTESWAKWHAKHPQLKKSASAAHEARGASARSGGGASTVHVKYHPGSKTTDPSYQVHVKTAQGRTLERGPAFPVPKIASSLQGNFSPHRDKLAHAAHIQAHGAAAGIAKAHGITHVQSGRHAKDREAG